MSSKCSVVSQARNGTPFNFSTLTIYIGSIGIYRREFYTLAYFDVR